LKFACDFCGRPKEAVHFLISGPRVFVCDDCVLAFIELAREGRAVHDPLSAIKLSEGGARAGVQAPPCSFCGKTARETLFSYFGVHGQIICNECVGLCIDILAEKFSEIWSRWVDLWPEIESQRSGDLN
jgi:ATP-dependent protease Clp ATPase subunit